jgi:Methyltransferase domain
MYRFWTRFVKPVIETAAPKRVIEIGAGTGANTERLLTHFQAAPGHLDIVDPAPHPSLAIVLARFGADANLHRQKSLEALQLLAPADLILVDGDHNWFTVHSELDAIFRRAAETGSQPPILLFHDVAWPYGRRDMYYEPEAIPAEHRHPYAYRAILPGRNELGEDGVNGGLANALNEGGPRNGVLTAIEDFLAETRIAADFRILPFYHGLGILVPAPRATPALAALIASFFTTEALLASLAALEADAIRAQVDLAKQRLR